MVTSLLESRYPEGDRRPEENLDLDALFGDNEKDDEETCFFVPS